MGSLKGVRVPPNKRIAVKQGCDIERHLDQSWYRGEHCNFIASKINLTEHQAIDRYIVHGWAPTEPFISKQHSITAFGSCFAYNVSKYLWERGYKVNFGADPADSSLVGTHEFRRDLMQVYVINCGAGLNTSFAVRQQFEWAYDIREFSEDLWYDAEKQLCKPTYDIKRATRDVFDTTDIFILTLGLAEVWYSKASNEVFWRAIPQNKFDPERHGFRVSTVQENNENLETIYSIIRAARPEATLIVTLSPVPLNATFRPVSCITANAVSKSILRVAIDEFCRAHQNDSRLFYFPSYEIVKEFFSDPYGDDNRHVKPEIISEVMATFHRHYLLDTPEQ